MPFILAQVTAAILLTISFWLPFWHMTLISPAHPEGRRLTSYLDQLQGPLESALRPVGGLDANLLDDLAQLEHSLDLALVIVTFFLLAAALLARSRWAALLAVPAAIFPLIVVADTAQTLFEVMVSLSPGASVLKTWPTLQPFGRMVVGPIALEVRPGVGFIVAVMASVAVLASLWLHFKDTHRFAKIQR